MLGFDVSLEASSVCIVDASGKIVRETKVPSEPEDLIAWDDGLGQAVNFAGGAWIEARQPRASEIGPALSSSNTIRRQPCADPVQKHDPGSDKAQKGLTTTGPLQKQSLPDAQRIARRHPRKAKPSLQSRLVSRDS